MQVGIQSKNKWKESEKNHVKPEQNMNIQTMVRFVYART